MADFQRGAGAGNCTPEMQKMKTAPRQAQKHLQPRKGSFLAEAAHFNRQCSSSGVPGTPDPVLSHSGL